MHLNELKKQKDRGADTHGPELNIENASGLRKQELIFSILQAYVDKNESVYGEGVLEILSEGFGFLRSTDSNYLPGPDDIYVSPSQIKDLVSERAIRPPVRYDRRKTTKSILLSSRWNRLIMTIPASQKTRSFLITLPPFIPTNEAHLETTHNNLSTRVMDLFTPIGKGQRALIVAPPRTGKTMLLQAIANSITENHKEIYLIVLLIDERPEEVTDMMRSVRARSLVPPSTNPPRDTFRWLKLLSRRRKDL